MPPILSNEVRRGHDPQLIPLKLNECSSFNGRSVPAVREPKDTLVCRHHVKLHLINQPSANWSTLRRVLGKTEPAKTIREARIFSVRGDFHYYVNIVCCTHRRSCRVGDQEPRGAATNEDDFRKQGLQPCRHRGQKLSIRLGTQFLSRAESSRFASSRSRALPSRRASTSASNW